MRLSPAVTLRDVTQDDLPILFEQQMDPVANRMAAFPARERGAFLEHWARILVNPAVAKQAIIFNDRLAGNILSFDVPGERLVGYWIGRDYWGQGIATRALEAFLDHERSRPLHAHTAKHNVASLRVLQKCGFSIIGEGRVAPALGEEEVEEYVLALP